MRAHIMNFHVARQDLIKGIQTAFNKTYPFLKIEFSRKGGSPDGKAVSTNGASFGEGVSAAIGAGLGESSEEERNILSAAQKLLWEEFSISDDMKVSELEILLQYQFSLPVQILRKSGNLWMETRSNRDWTLQQQNNHGEDISSGFE